MGYRLMMDKHKHRRRRYHTDFFLNVFTEANRVFYIRQSTIFAFRTIFFEQDVKYSLTVDH